MMTELYYFSFVGKEQGVFDVIIINDNLDNAYEHLKNALIEVGVYYRTQLITTLSTVSNALNACISILCFKQVSHSVTQFFHYRLNDD